MSGQEMNTEVDVEELSGLDAKQQAECIADHYASISNMYEPVKEEDFQDFLKNITTVPPNVGPFKVLKTIRKMKKNVATVKGDLPMKIISEFADIFTLPLTHIIHTSLQQCKYPNIWKNETISPVHKVFPQRNSNTSEKL